MTRSGVGGGGQLTYFWYKSVILLQKTPVKKETLSLHWHKTVLKVGIVSIRTEHANMDPNFFYYNPTNGYMVSNNHIYTICPRSSDPFYLVSYFIKWVFLDTGYYLGYNSDTNFATSKLGKII